MRVLKAATFYFLIVFGAGFLLGLVRVHWLVPRLGTRTAELLEMPVMLAVILLAARRLARTEPWLDRRDRLLAGGTALALLVGAELALAALLRGAAPVAYVAARDPVSSGAYLACLLVFALAPAAWPIDRGARA